MVETLANVSILILSPKNIDFFYHQGPTQLQNTITGNCDAIVATCPVDSHLSSATRVYKLSAQWAGILTHASVLFWSEMKSSSSYLEEEEKSGSQLRWL